MGHLFDNDLFQILYLVFAIAVIEKSIILVVFFWYFGGKEFGTVFGFEFLAPDAPPVIGLGHFTTPDFLWFYIYFVLIFLAI